MADEDEIDILGDFSLNAFSSQSETNMLDGTPLVSQNSDLLNCDYTIHPQWLLDKPSANPDNWYETNSSASTSDVSESDALGHVSTENYITDESGWTEKEKNLLHRGIEIFGKSSVRLSQFVGSKTASEVRYYLKNYFTENQRFYEHSTSSVAVAAKNVSESVMATEVLDANQIPASIEEVIAVVSTGSTTVSYTPTKKVRTKSSSSTTYNSNETSQTKSFQKSKGGKGKETAAAKSGVVARRQSKSKETKSGVRSGQGTFKFKFKTKVQLGAKKRGRPSLKNANVLFHLASNRDVGKAELITGRGLSVAVCAGEEIVKIEHAEDDSSDISIDIENMEEVQKSLVKSPEKVSTQPHSISESSKVGDTLTSVNKDPDLSHLDKDEAEQLTSLEKPTAELVLDLNKISDLEKLVHQEFFEGRPSKTPERYLKIRNHIINSWKNQKPNYVTKTSMRQGLKRCGDVTCISKIHYILEQIGAINFGCEQTKYERPLYDMIQIFNSQKHKPARILPKADSGKLIELGARQRIKKKFTYDGEGGCTLVHGDQGEVINTTIINEEPVKPRSYVKKPSIRLIYCRPFTQEKPQEYTVRLSLSTLLLMDFHAHTYLTEVMGLVGGLWDSHSKTLTITCYEPCRNVASSATHCDMCPVSQAKAAENIHSKKLRILGWFHSHPTFAPEPSHQDLETQKFVQQWIGHTKPCIGIILTPFSCNGALISSPFRCLMVDKKPNFDDQLIPFRFKVDVIADEFDVTSFSSEMRRILRLEDGYLKEKRVSFHRPYFQDLTISHLDKFISSVNMHLAKNGALSKTTCDELVAEIKNVLQT